MTAWPASRLTSVDLPVPDEPEQDERAGRRKSARRSSIPSPVTLLTAKTGTPTATVSASASLPGSSSTSSFVSTMTGSAPLSQAAVR